MAHINSAVVIPLSHLYIVSIIGCEPMQVHLSSDARQMHGRHLRDAKKMLRRCFGRCSNLNYQKLLGAVYQELRVFLLSLQGPQVQRVSRALLYKLLKKMLANALLLQSTIITITNHWDLYTLAKIVLGYNGKQIKPPFLQFMM